MGDQETSPASPSNKKDKHFFFYNEVKIEASRSPLTGGEIKNLIAVQVPSFDRNHQLVLEGHGQDEDTIISDGASVSIERGDGEGVRRFYSKPPANFGA